MDTTARTGWRLRGATLTASALVVLSICAMLWWFSRVIASYDAPPVTGVEVSLVRPTPPRPQTRRAPPPPATRASAAVAPSTETTLPVGGAMLSRTLACADPHPERRPADCPRSAEPRFGAAPQYAPSEGFGEDPLRLNRGYTIAEQATLLTPSCRRDGGPPGMVSVCATIGRDPPRPSRSAEEICEAGGIGPCHPPEFRADEVVRGAHTN